MITVAAVALFRPQTQDLAGDAMVRPGTGVLLSDAGGKAPTSPDG